MARAQKVGLDYFPHDVDMFLDQKMRIIKAKHGLLGYAVFIRLLEEIYRDKGYYLEHTEDFAFIFCDDNNIDVNVYNNMINDYINYDLFDKNVYKNHNILTSKRIQLTYFEAAKRRTSINLLDGVVIECREVNDYINSINVNINSINDAKSTQSKEEKNREEEIREKDIEAGDVTHNVTDDVTTKKTKKSNELNPKDQQHQEKIDEILSTYGDDLKQTVKDFVEHRKAIDKKFTLNAEKLLLMALEKMTDDEMTKIAILEQSIMNGWKGLFALKDNKSNSHNGKPKDIKEWQRHQKGGPGHYI